MFSNPLGSVFNNKPEGEEKKKKRNRKTKKLSPELSEESLGSKNDLSGAQEPQTSISPMQQLCDAGNTLLDIVSEINNPQDAAVAPEEPVVAEAAPATEEPVVVADEQIETQYEELPVGESTMKTIIDSIHSSVYSSNRNLQYSIYSYKPYGILRKLPSGLNDMRESLYFLNQNFISSFTLWYYEI